MAPETFRVLAALSSGWLGEKSLESEGLLISPQAWLRGQQAPARCESCLFCQMQIMEERGVFMTFFFLEGLQTHSAPGKTYVILQNGMSNVMETVR